MSVKIKLLLRNKKKVFDQVILNPGSSPGQALIQDLMRFRIKPGMTKTFFFYMILSFMLISTAYAIPPKLNPLPSDYHTGISWEKAKKDDKPIVANFYVDWCNACRRFAPILEKARKEYNDKFNFVIIKTDDPMNANLIKKYNIRSFPSVYIIDKKSDREIFLDQRKYFDPDEFKKELDKFLED